MMRSLYSGISGLRNFQTRMDVIGNNIANINTVAYKSGRVTFADVIAQSIAGANGPGERFGGTNPMQVGLGMRTASVDTRFAQGSLEATGITTDLAIQGNGFFVVSDGEQNYFTRAGTFNIDGEGNLVFGPNGYAVQGFIGSEEVSQLGLAGADGIQIPLGRRSPASATSEVMLHGNLDMNMTQSAATLINSGTTGIVNMNGTAEDGVGGSHQIVITGQNAIQSQASGATQAMDLTDTLSGLGVTDVDGFSITVDGDRTIAITGLTTSSTVGELINAINRQVTGVEAELDGDGAISITRSYYGNGAQYNVQLNDTGASDMVANIFNAGGTFDVNNGSASTLAAVNNFTPTGEATAIQRTLELKIDEQTGLVTDIAGLGGGGVFINATGGLAAGTAVIETADTSHTTSIYVYDSLGDIHNLTVTFTRSADPLAWNWTVDLPESATLIEGGGGTVRFGDDGSLEELTYEGNVEGLSFTPGNGAQNVNIQFNAGTFGDLDGMTLTAGATSAMAIDQDGFGMGQLLGIEIDTKGQVVGNFSNGTSEILAQIMLASIGNPGGMERVSDNMFQVTLNSGSIRLSDAESLGSIISSGYLEMSNVDLSQEFTDMIVTQRAFGATAKVITTSDQLLQELVNLKR